MKLTAAELAFVHAQRLYITEKCDGCGKLLNQTFRYTIAGNPEAYCSTACRDFAFFADPKAARKHSAPGRCVYCGAGLKGKRRGALYCEHVCQMRAHWRYNIPPMGSAKITVTPAQPNQRLPEVKIGSKGNGPARVDSLDLAARGGQIGFRDCQSINGRGPSGRGEGIIVFG
jgi:ferredoxin